MPVVPPSPFRSKAFPQHAPGEGRWVTMEGAHVHLDGQGEIDKGPPALEGKKPGALPPREHAAPTPPRAPGGPFGVPAWLDAAVAGTRKKINAGGMVDEHGFPVNYGDSISSTLDRLAGQGVKFPSYAQLPTHGTSAAGLMHLLDHGIDPGREFHSGPVDPKEAAGGYGVGSTKLGGSTALVFPPLGGSFRSGGVGAVLLGVELQRAKDELQRRYPKVRFFTVADLPKILNAAAGKRAGGAKALSALAEGAGGALVAPPQQKYCPRCGAAAKAFPGGWRCGSPPCEWSLLAADPAEAVAVKSGEFREEDHPRASDGKFGSGGGGAGGGTEKPAPKKPERRPVAAFKEDVAEQFGHVTTAELPPEEIQENLAAIYEESAAALEGHKAAVAGEFRENARRDADAAWVEAAGGDWPGRVADHFSDFDSQTNDAYDEVRGAMEKVSDTLQDAADAYAAADEDTRDDAAAAYEDALEELEKAAADLPPALFRYEDDLRRALVELHDECRDEYQGQAEEEAESLNGMTFRDSPGPLAEYDRDVNRSLEEVGSPFRVRYLPDSDEWEVYDPTDEDEEGDDEKRLRGWRTKAQPAAPAAGPSPFREADHPRAQDGKFGPGGGGSPKKPAGRPANTAPERSRQQTTQEAKAAATAALQQVGAMSWSALKRAGVEAGRVEHAAKEWAAWGLDRTFGALPSPLGRAARGLYVSLRLGTAASFSIYTAGQAAAEAVARERGATPDEAQKLRQMVSVLDILAMKPAMLTTAGLGLGAAAVAGLSFIPVGSTSYLLYSTARDIPAVARAAAKAVAKAVGSFVGKKGMVVADRAEGLLEEVLQGLRTAGPHGADWWAALYYHALDATGDPAAAVALASQLAESEGVPAAGLPNDVEGYGQKSAGPHKYGCLMAVLPPEIAAGVKALARSLPARDLGPGGREDDPHVTVKYGFRDGGPGMLEAVRAFLAGRPPLKARLGGLTTFAGPNADGTPLKFDVDSPDLRQLNAATAYAFPTADKHPVYQPHVTVAYLRPGAPPPAADHPLVGTEFLVTELDWSGADGTKATLRLGGGDS